MDDVIYSSGILQKYYVKDDQTEMQWLSLFVIMLLSLVMFQVLHSEYIHFISKVNDVIKLKVLIY